MSRGPGARGLAVGLAAFVGACATTPMAVAPTPVEGGWTAAPAAVRLVGLGLPGGAQLAPGVTFAGGIELVLDESSSLHSLSDLKLVGDDGDFVSVSDAGDLVHGRLMLDAAGWLTGVEGLAVRRLTRLDGAPIVDKADGDAEGLALLANGELLVSFERQHRIWNYGPARQPRDRPRSVASPEFPFTLNDGMEGIAAYGAGWRVTGESGGVWDCAAPGCRVVVAPPETPLADGEYRITGMDRNPAGDGLFVVERAYTPPVDARARVRRMAADGALGPVLVELKLPSTTDNFEGVAAERRAAATRLYILSDDNNNAVQRTLLLAFDVADVRPAR